MKANLLLDHYKIDQSGSLVEEFVKNLFNKMFNPRFRATSGYIVSAEGHEKPYKFSPHIDLIIVDALVPNVIFPQTEFENKTEFVPKEAVVGIFEVKKKLDANTFETALEHIRKVRSAVDIKKNDETRYLVGGMGIGQGLQSHIYSNPILGVIGLESDPKVVSHELKHIGIDIAFTFDGFCQALAMKGASTLYCGPILNVQYYEFLLLPHSKTNLSISLGYVTYYLQRTSGKHFDIISYYLNKNLLNN